MAIPNNFEEHWELRKPRYWLQISGSPITVDPYRRLDARMYDKSLPDGAGVVVANGFINPLAIPYFRDYIFPDVAQHGVENVIAHVWTGIRGHTGGFTAQEYYTSAFYDALNNTMKNVISDQIIPRVTNREIKFELYIGAIVPDHLNSTDWGVTGTIEDSEYPQEFHYFGQGSEVRPIPVGVSADTEWFVKSLSGSYSSGVWFDAMSTTADVDLVLGDMASYVGTLRKQLPPGNSTDADYFFGVEGLPLILLTGTYLGYPGGRKSSLDPNRTERLPFLTTLNIKRQFDPQSNWQVDPTRTAYHVIVFGSNYTGNSTFTFPSVPTEAELLDLHNKGFCIGFNADIPESLKTFIMSLAELDRQRVWAYYDYVVRQQNNGVGLDDDGTAPPASLRTTVGGGSKQVAGQKLISRNGRLYTEEQIRILDRNFRS